MNTEFKRKDIESTKLENKIMAGYFHTLKDAMENKSQKIAWCTSVGPAELLRSMGFLVYFPENHAAMLGATRLSTDMISSAAALGFSQNVCSYMTSDIGAFLNNKTPLTQAYGLPSIPKPDVLVYNTSQCRDVEDWFEWYGRKFKVPALGMHTPRDIDDNDQYLCAEASRQIQAMVEPLERISGNKFSITRLSEVIAESKRTSLLWNKCLETSANKPAPWTFFDQCIHMGPAVVLRGDKIASTYYETLLKELKERVSDGIDAVNGEKHRLAWIGIPVWGKIGALAKQLGSLKSNIVVSTYCSSWVFDDLNPEKPFESLGKVYSGLYISGSAKRKAKTLNRFFTQYNVDAIVYHDAFTCPYCSENRYALPGRIREENNIPYVILDGDLNDLRCYSEEQSKTKIEALIESLENS